MGPPRWLHFLVLCMAFLFQKYLYSLHFHLGLQRYSWLYYFVLINAVFVIQLFFYFFIARYGASSPALLSFAVHSVTG